MTKDMHYVCGIHAVNALIAHSVGRVKRVLFNAAGRNVRREQIVAAARAAGIPTVPQSGLELDELVPGVRHQGLVAQILPQDVASFSELILRLNDNLRAFVLVLDGVQDPGNLGACLRSAAAAGADAVIVPKAHSAMLTTAVHRAASGATEHIPFVVVPNLARALRALSATGLYILGAESSALTSLAQAKPTRPLALVVGGEGRGLRRLTKEYCDLLVRIPLSEHALALNVSVAVGILLYEVCRGAD